MRPLAPSPPSVDRFRSAVEALGLGSDRLGLAVSGGPDSLALLLLGAAAFPERVEAATVDHGLRPEGVAEARFVAELCAALGVPHAILAVEVPRDGASVQMKARRARYAALGDWIEARALAALATAHHLDDQAETLMMRLLRGSGVSGLAAIRALGPIPGRGGQGRLVRPLLGWRRHDLRRLVEDAGIEPVDDPSNRDPRFDRARLRERLAGAPWLDPVPLARSAAALAEADAALEWTVAMLARERLARDGPMLRLDAAGIPAELQRRLVLAALGTIHPEMPPPRGEEVARLLERLRAGKAATLGEVACRGGAIWTFAPAPPRRRPG